MLLCFFFSERILRVTLVTELKLAHHAVSAEKKQLLALTGVKLLGNIAHESPLKALCFRVSSQASHPLRFSKTNYLSLGLNAQLKYSTISVMYSHKKRTA